MASNSTFLKSNASSNNPFSLEVEASVSGDLIYATATLKNTYKASGFSGGSGTLAIKVDGTTLASKTVTSLNPNTSTAGLTTSTSGTGQVSENGSYTVTATWTVTSSTNYIPKSGSVSVTVSVTGAGGSSGGGGGGSTGDTTYFVPATITATNGTVGGEITVTIDNPGASYGTKAGVYVRLEYAGYKSKDLLIFKNEGTYKLTIPTELNNYITNSTTAQVIVIAETWDSYHTSGYNYTLVGTNSAYITVTTTDEGLSAGTLGVDIQTTAIEGMYIQDHTDLKVSFSGVSPSNGASIANIKVSYASQSVNITDGSTSGSFTTGNIPNSGTINFTLTVTDSRGYTKSTSISKTFLAYQPPQITTFSADRYLENGVMDSRGSICKTTVAWTYTTLDGRNSITVHKIDVQEYGGQWQNMIPSAVSGTTYQLSGTYSQSKSYYIRLTLTDTVGETTTKIITLSTEPVMIDFFNRGDGVAIGKVAEASIFDVGMDTKIDNGTMLCQIDSGIWLGDEGKLNGLYISSSGTIYKRENGIDIQL